MPKTSTKPRRKALSKQSEPLHRQLLTRTTALLVDVQCIRDLFQTVTPIIEEQDKKSLERLSLLIEKLNSFMKQKQNDGAASRKFAITYTELKTLRDAVMRLNRTNVLFRNNSLTTLVSMFDSFLSAVLDIALFAYPERLNTSEKSIPYDEVLGFTSIEDIRRNCVMKEVQRVMRGSHDEQFRYLESLTNLKHRETLPMWRQFIEITERRNVHVHCSGKVSRQYLKVCREHDVCLPCEVKEGDHLPITDDYFRDACTVVWLMGFTLGQTIARKIFPKELESADKRLNELGFDLLLSGDWSLAVTVFDFATKLPIKVVKDDFYRKMFLINKCIALKFSGKIKECVEQLDTVDWSSSASRYLLAVEVLKDNFAEAAKLMATAARGKDAISEAQFREWPLFKDFRSTDEFQKSFRKIFKKDFTDVSLATLADLRSEVKIDKDPKDTTIQ